MATLVCIFCLVQHCRNDLSGNGTKVATKCCCFHTCRSAVGTWSGYLFGLVQDLVDNDDAVDGLALAYADESRLVDSSGAVKQLILQVKVR